MVGYLGIQQVALQLSHLSDRLSAAVTAADGYAGGDAEAAEVSVLGLGVSLRVSVPPAADALDGRWLMENEEPGKGTLYHRRNPCISLHTEHASLSFPSLHLHPSLPLSPLSPLCICFSPSASLSPSTSLSPIPSLAFSKRSPSNDVTIAIQVYLNMCVRVFEYVCVYVYMQMYAFICVDRSHSAT